MPPRRVPRPAPVLRRQAALAVNTVRVRAYERRLPGTAFADGIPNAHRPYPRGGPGGRGGGLPPPPPPPPPPPRPRSPRRADYRGYISTDSNPDDGWDSDDQEWYDRYVRDVYDSPRDDDSVVEVPPPEQNRRVLAIEAPPPPPSRVRSRQKQPPKKKVKPKPKKKRRRRSSSSDEPPSRSKRSQVDDEKKELEEVDMVDQVTEDQIVDSYVMEVVTETNQLPSSRKVSLAMSFMIPLQIEEVIKSHEYMTPQGIQKVQQNWNLMANSYALRRRELVGDVQTKGPLGYLLEKLYNAGIRHTYNRIAVAFRTRYG